MSRVGRCRGLSLALAAAALLAVSVAPAAARADAVQARIHFDRGRTYFEVDEYRKAIEEFKAAHVEKADPAFLYNIAECYRHLGETREALVYYRRFMSLAPASDRSRPAVEKRIAELQAQGAEPRAPVREPALRPASASELDQKGGLVPPGAPSARLADGSSAPVLVGGPSAPAPEAAPFYKRTWFIVGAVAVVVAGVVGVWALTRGQDVPATPLGNQSVFQ